MDYFDVRKDTFTQKNGVQLLQPCYTIFKATLNRNEKTCMLLIHTQVKTQETKNGTITVGATKRLDQEKKSETLTTMSRSFSFIRNSA